MAAAPEIVIGQPVFSAPVPTSTACATYWGVPELPDLYSLSRKYAVCVAASMAGVPVTPTCGERSGHPMSDALNGVPRVRCHCCAPVCGSRPYTLLFSVATRRVPFAWGGELPRTSGCA